MYNEFYGSYLLGVMETQKASNICFTSHFSTNNISVQIVTRDETAIGMFNNYSYDVMYMYVISIPISSLGHFDYVPVNKTVSFHGRQVHCVNIQIVNDELTENDERFYVEVMVESRKLVSLLVIISQDSKYKSI